MAVGDVVPGVEDNGEDVMLADPHECLKMIALLRDHPSLKHLRGIDPAVVVVVPHQVLEVRGFDSGSEDGAAPVVQKRSGEIWGLWREPLENQLALVQFALLSGIKGREEGGLRAMLLRESRLDRTDVGVESRNGCGRRLGKSYDGTGQKN